MQDASAILARIAAGEIGPGLSPLARELVRQFWDERCVAADFCRAVSADPEFERELIDSSNREYFHPTFTASTIRQAVLKMGFSTVRKFALVLGVTRSLEEAGGRELRGARRWRVALCRATVAEFLADYAVGRKSDQAFVTAFFLEFGQTLFGEVFGPPETVSCREKPHSVGDCLRWQRETYGADHRQVGAAQLAAWGFPESARSCLLHPPGSADGSALARACDLASIFARLLYEDFADLYAYFETARRHFGLDDQEAGDAAIAALGEMKAVAELLVVDLSFRQGVRDLLGKAAAFFQGLNAKLSGEAPAPAPEAAAPDGLPDLASLSGDGATRRTLAAVAHEVRNPLMAVAGFARRLSLTLDPASREREYAEIILEEGRRLEAVLNQMSHGPARRARADEG